MKSNVLHLALILCLLLACSYGYGQSGCTQLDKSQPLLYISYERHADEKLIFSLHNNTSCDIYIQTNDGPTMFTVINLTAGKTKLEPRRKGSGDDFYEFSNNEIIGDLIYELRDNRNDRQLSTTSNGHYIYTRRLRTATSVYFKLPPSAIKKNSTLAIPFSYDWEEKTVPIRRGGAAHQIYFSWPDELFALRK